MLSFLVNRLSTSMSESVLESIIVEPRTQADAAVIWLHGLGADGHDFQPIVASLGLDQSLAVRFIFPHAPMRAVTLNNGFVMRAWYDITGQELNDREDAEGIQQSRYLVDQLIVEQYAQGIAYDKIILAGFSQGGAIALFTGCQYQQHLGGIIALSTYLPLHQQFKANPANLNTPIFMAHGDADPMVLPQWGQSAKDFLQTAGFHIEWHSYAMQHAVCPQEILAIGQWLNKQLMTKETSA